MTALRGHVYRGREMAEPPRGVVVAGGWFYDVVDFDQPDGNQLVVVGVRLTQPDAFAACERAIRARWLGE